MRAVPPLASVRAVLDRARAHVPPSELPRLVMNDPGHGAYVAAYERVLAEGVPALFEDDDTGVPLLRSFDITENLLLSHGSADVSVTHRWFSVLTACIELLGASEVRGTPLSATLGGLLNDGFVLNETRVPGAPLDLLPLVCRELQQTRRTDPHDVVLALLGELLTAPLTEAETEDRCRALHAHHDAFQRWYGDDGEANPFYARRPEFLWGAVVSRAELPTWLALVESRFPRSPDVANATRERLLREGGAWLRSSRRPPR